MINDRVYIMKIKISQIKISGLFNLTAWRASQNLQGMVWTKEDAQAIHIFVDCLHHPLQLNRRAAPFGHTLLMGAAMMDDAVLAQKLLDKGAALHLQSKTGETAIEFAASRGSMDVLRLLIEKEAHLHVTPQGKSVVDAALFKAVCNKQVAAFYALIDAGAQAGKGNPSEHVSTVSFLKSMIKRKPEADDDSGRALENRVYQGMLDYLNNKSRTMAMGGAPATAAQQPATDSTPAETPPATTAEVKKAVRLRLPKAPNE